MDTFAMTESGESAPQGLSIQQLLGAVENELIPRLLCAHRREVSEGDSPARRARPISGPWASDDRIERFATLCAEDDADAVSEHISALVSQGVGLDAIYLFLVAPAARVLGTRWEEDTASFIDVQIGLGRMHSLLCDCVPVGFHHAVSSPHSVLLSSVPGDQHTFAIALVADFFRRFGWQASNLCGLSEQFLLDRIATSHYDAIGFSINSSTARERINPLLRRLRKRSRNSQLIVMVGGEFSRSEDGAVAIDADLFATDAHAAVLEAERKVASVRADAIRAGGAASRAEGRFAMVE